MKKSILILSLVLFSFTVNAQDSAKTEKIKQLLELSGSGKMGIQVMDQMMNSFKSSYSTVKQEFWEEFRKEINPSDIENIILPIYETYYTEDDIDQMIAFYKSPIGKKNDSDNAVGYERIYDCGTELGKRNSHKSFS
ncbi:DUF2059 domain-containing protein [Flavobacterium flavipallidum]|uniref:DUF2059 domain-containing protein n=1 Tax=Flavobacterium flavipallidum TaxID=3139140 RepID=A0ABU9HNQ0_9FLAO